MSRRRTVELRKSSPEGGVVGAGVWSRVVGHAVYRRGLY